ncbi:MAG TPA: murein biosynthesis integral membrane protein MurJ [Dehalococcoidia bacterium]|nr:murein biosynthesis integral membrane protein MurJ [Dehalococcoidia bacterium]
MTTASLEGNEKDIALGGYSALAESAWMGAAQASEVLDSLRGSHASPRAAVPGARSRIAGLLTREFTVAQATVILAASFFISAMLGSVRQVLFNAEFGAGLEASAYYAAFRLPDTLFSLIAGGALSSAMIPVLLSTSREDGEEATGRLVNIVLTALLATFVLVVVVGEIVAPAFVTHLLAPGFDDETSALTSCLTRIMLVQPVILVIGSVATAVLNSRSQFLLTALSVMSHNLALIAGILASRAIPGLGIYGPTLGVIGGAVLQVIILAPGLLQHRGGPRLVIDWHDARLAEVVRLLVPNGLAVGVGYVGFILDTSFASRAAEAAALAAVQNAWLMVGLPIALLGQAVGQAVFPRLAAHAADLDWHKMRTAVLQSLAFVVVLSLPALVGFFLLGRQMISTVFEQGKFDAAAGDLTFDLLLIYAVALPAYVATEVVTRGLISLRDTRTPLLTNALQMAGRGLIMAALISDRGATAIPIAFAVTASIETVLLATVFLTKLQLRVSAAPATV